MRYCLNLKTKQDKALPTLLRNILNCLYQNKQKGTLHDALTIHSCSFLGLFFCFLFVFFQTCFVSTISNLQHLGLLNRLPNCERDLLRRSCFGSGALKFSFVAFSVHISQIEPFRCLLLRGAERKNKVSGVG